MALTDENKQTLMLAGGLSLGAAVMYLLDPEHGRARRSLLHDKVTQAWRQIGAAAQISSTDLGNRLTGLVADTWSAARRVKVADDILADRVRARLGHVVAHPSSIDVKAEEGVVTLAGDLPENQLEEVLKAVKSVHGVSEVRSQLKVCGPPTELPAPGVRQHYARRWAPATRVLAGGAGGLLTLYGARRRGLLGSAAGTLGLSMLARAATNRGLKDLVGLGANGITVQKTINIGAPVSEVFEFWANPENYPRVMAHVQEVKKVGENRYHWKVASPAGLSVEWEGSITRIIPNELVAWESLPGSLVANSGVARLDPNYDGSTRLHIRMSYQPPGGVLGHVIAELFGADPKSALDEDLMRLKGVFERGKTRLHGHTVTLEQIEHPSATQAATNPA